MHISYCLDSTISKKRDLEQITRDLRLIDSRVDVDIGRWSGIYRIFCARVAQLPFLLSSEKSEVVCREQSVVVLSPNWSSVDFS